MLARFCRFTEPDLSLAGILMSSCQIGCAGFLLALLVLTGCGPRVGPEELGKVVYTLPDVPGSQQPYPLPALEGSGTVAGGPTKGAGTVPAATNSAEAAPKSE
jgi:hypothetical protein